jgi:photosynthetic reaction center cytochrome c subunit
MAAMHPAALVLPLSLLLLSTAAAPRTAGEAYANVRVLREAPADQLIPAMELISASLGVSCDHCHVPGAFEKDEKPPKEAARRMMRMMRAINDQHFEGRRQVTCFSCHRGSDAPAVDPPAGEPGAAERPLQVVETAASAARTSADVFAGYLRAAGGDALRAVTSRVGRGAVTVFGGRRYPFEVFQAAPLKVSTSMHLPGGANAWTYDGKAGAVSMPGRPVRPMTGAEVAGAVLANDFTWAVDPARVFTDSRVAGQATIDGRDVIVVETRVDGHAVELAFDLNGGLLRRLLAWTETPLGRLPTRVDYGEYREVGGVMAPVVWTVARPQGAFTVELSEVEHGVAIDDSRFSAPVPEAHGSD